MELFLYQSIQVVSIHRLLRAWPDFYLYPCHITKVSIHRLLRAWPPLHLHPHQLLPLVSIHRLLRAWPMFSDCTSLTDLFRSTGSYEPDQETSRRDGEQLWVSIHRLLRAWPPLSLVKILVFLCFDPQALTSLTKLQMLKTQIWNGFDPQALTSLTQ